MSNLAEKEAMEAEELTQGALIIPKKFIVKIVNKKKGTSTNFVTYEGLLDLSHQKGIQSLEADLIQLPSKDNEHTVIAKATLVGTNGQRFEDYGDACPNSVNAMVIPHIIRVALTRAKARVMRDFTNVGMCCIDEVNREEYSSDVEEVFVAPSEKQKQILTKNMQSLGLTIEDIETISKSKASELIDSIFNNNKKGSTNNSSNNISANNSKYNNSVNNGSNTKEDTNKVSPKGNQDLATSGQVSYLENLTKQLAAKLGKTKEQIESEITQSNGVSSFAELSKTSAIELVSTLKAKLTA